MRDGRRRGVDPESGGFGSFSEADLGTAASSLLEAEVVTADGRLRTVNACSDPLSSTGRSKAAAAAVTGES